MSFFDKAKKLAGKHGDTVTKAVDKATDVADKQTKGKYTTHLDKVDDTVKKTMDKHGKKGEGTT
jgi:hypothetical protein